MSFGFLILCPRAEDPADFVLDLARNGELQSRISTLGSLSLACSRYYAAQIVDVLEYMHSKGVLHRYVNGHGMTCLYPRSTITGISSRRMFCWTTISESRYVTSALGKFWILVRRSVEALAVPTCDH